MNPDVLGGLGLAALIGEMDKPAEVETRAAPADGSAGSDASGPASLPVDSPAEGEGTTLSPACGSVVAPSVPGLGKALGIILFLIAATLPFIITTFFAAQERQFINLAILIMTYVMLGWGLNIVVGLAGLLDLGYVAFYAVGAYSFALLAQHFGLGFWTALPLAGVLLFISQTGDLVLGGAALFALAWGAADGGREFLTCL